MTKNNFGRLKKVLVGDFPDHNLMRHTYDAMGNTQAWLLYRKIADESKKDLDNLSTFYKDHGVTVLRPKFDPFVNNRWSQIKFKAPFNTANRFFAYGDLVFYLSTADDSEVPYTDFFRSCMEHMHDEGKNVFTNPLTLETSTMQSYTDSDWPGDEGFCLDAPCFFPVENRIFYNRKHSNTIPFDKYVHIHFDEKWIFEDYIRKYTNIEPNESEFLEFLNKIIKKNKKIIITTGKRSSKLLGFLKGKINDNDIKIFENQNLLEIESIVFNSELLITCHGWISHIASAKKIRQIDIIDKTYPYNTWTSHFRNYTSLDRKPFSLLSQEIIDKI